MTQNTCQTYSKEQFLTYEVFLMENTPRRIHDGVFTDFADVEALLRSILVVKRSKVGYMDADGNEYAVLTRTSSEYEMALFSGLVND